MMTLMGRHGSWRYCGISLNELSIPSQVTVTLTLLAPPFTFPFQAYLTSSPTLARPSTKYFHAHESRLNNPPRNPLPPPPFFPFLLFTTRARITSSFGLTR